MTRRLDGMVFCPHCRKAHSQETAFERWMRGQEELDSKFGLVRFDLDVLIHRYMTPTDKRSTRDIQCLMAVEVKTHNGQLRPAQRDTFSMLSQVLRNRKTNIHHKKRGLHLCDHTPISKAFSRMLGKRVTLRMFGMHLLTLSGNDPTDSASIVWDNRQIDPATLTKLLRFDIDPDSLREMDWRRRYSDFNEPTLFSLGSNQKEVAVAV